MNNNHHGDKNAQLEALAFLRQKESWPGYQNISDFHGGVYDCLHVSPYTRGVGNIDASVFILLQNWCSSKYLQEPIKECLIRLGRDPSLPTNLNLSVLLERWLGISLEDCYVTNLMPFIKTGEMNEDVDKLDMRRAAKEFALPQIEVIQPKIVLCLGTLVFASLRHAMGLTLSLGRGSQIGKSYRHKNTIIWCQAHPGGRGCANRGG